MSTFIRIKKSGPFINEQLNYHNALNEIARVDNPRYDNLPNNIKIYIYGENDEPGVKTPHFHVIGENFEFEIFIEHINELNIWRTKRIDKKGNANTWNERANIRDAIKDWLIKPHNRFAPKTNADVIVDLWCMSNPTHEIEPSFKD